MEFWAEWIGYLVWPIIGVCYLLYRWGRRFFYWCGLGLAHKWHQARLYISAKIIYFLISANSVCGLMPSMIVKWS